MCNSFFFVRLAMVSKAASTTFQRGPLDNVVTGDPNKISSNEASNLLPVSEGGLSGGMLGKLIKKTGIGGAIDKSAFATAFNAASGGLLNGKAGSLVSQVQSVVDSGALDPDKIKERWQAVGMNATRNLDKLSGDMLANTLKATGWVDDATAKNLFGNGMKESINNVKAAAKGFKMMVDDVETFVKDIDFGSVTGISNLITAVTGNNEIVKVLGIQDKLAGLKLINDIANIWGVPKLADKLLGTLESEEDKKDYLLNLLPSAINSAHLENINLCIKHLGAPMIISMYPNAIGIILANYRLPPDIFTPTATQTSELLDVLIKLNKRWAFYNRSGAWIFDLEIFAMASDYAKQTLAIDKAYQIPAMYAMHNSIGSRPFNEVVKQYYPYY